MHKRARNPIDRDGPGDRAKSRAAYTLVIALLFALFAWLLIRSESSSSTVAAASETAGPSLSASEALSPDAIGAAAKSSDRTPVAEVGATDPPVPVVAKSGRLDTLVYGFLFDTSHAPVQGAGRASVRFVDRTGRSYTSAVTQVGDYSLQSLGFGSYWVTAHADGYRTVEELLELSADQPRMRTDFTLQDAVELRVKVVTPEGRKLLDVLMERNAPMAACRLVPIATREPPGKRFDGVSGSLNDKFGVGEFQDRRLWPGELQPEFDGRLLLDCDLPVWVSLVHFQVVLQSQRVEVGRSDVTFVVSPDELLADLATIRVHVVDAQTRLPIERARAMLRGGTYFDQGTATDPQGIATIERREPGRFELLVRANGYATSRQSIDALPGRMNEVPTIALEQGVTVEGRTLDLENDPLETTFALGLLDPADHSIRWFGGELFKTNGDGTFELRGLGRGEYVMKAGNHDGLGEREWKGVVWVSDNVLFDTRGGAISGLEVHLSPASRLVLRIPTGAADGMRFRVVDERGMELVGDRFLGAAPRPLSLPPGSYRVSLLDSQGTVISENAVTLGAEIVTLDLAR